MAMLGAALLFGAAEMWLTIVPTYGAPDITMGHLWAIVSLRSLNAMQALVTEHIWSPIWNIGIAPVLVAPAWSFFAVLGSLFFVLGRPAASDR
jgi:hypothetical protein